MQRALFADLQKDVVSKNSLKSTYLKKCGITALQSNAIRKESLWKFWREAAKKFETTVAAHFRGSVDLLYRRSA